jgi:NAD(P) transhydrogenase
VSWRAAHSVMTRYDFIGSGPAGRRAAIQAAKLGHAVLVVEKGRRVGGVSVHTGTIPSKTLRETVPNLTGWRERGFYGSAYRVKKDIQAKDLMMRLHMTLDHEVDVLEHQFARNKVQTMIGEGRFPDPHTVEITLSDGDIRVVSADKIMIAVGTRPLRPADVPFKSHVTRPACEYRAGSPQVQGCRSRNSCQRAASRRSAEPNPGDGWRRRGGPHRG